MREYHTRNLGFERFKKSEGWIVKVGEPNIWMRKAVILYENAYGPIPDGYNLRYLDGDKHNCTLDNIVCVSRYVHILLNSKYKNIKDPELIKIAIEISRLQEKRYLLAKENNRLTNSGEIKQDKVEWDRNYHSSHNRINGHWVEK